MALYLDAESISSDGHSTRPVRVEDKEKEQKRDVEGSKEKERCREKYMGKSIQELDLSDCKRCTPSYRLLPDDVSNFFPPPPSFPFLFFFFSLFCFVCFFFKLWMMVHTVLDML